MKRIFLIIRLLALLSFVATPIFATSVPQKKPTIDRVYRTNKISDSYHFILLASNGFYYTVHTNKTKSLTVRELKSSSILKILNKKQSWGQAFTSKGKYIRKNGNIYTERYFDRIEILSSKKIKYLNKVYQIQ
jgi:hypothetical protein